jgi:2-(1,2-epoxy-1,2-dihydrophenyl)acetyl-CoA isomerase
MTETQANPPRVEISVERQIATIALNRPEVRNAVDDAMRAELIAAFDRLAADTGVRAVIVTGRGAAFCAGGDIAGMQRRLEAPAGEVALNGWQRQQRTHRLMAALHDLPKPTIAAVNGAAAGLGCDLALCCDFIVASESSSFVMSYVLRGLIPDGGGMYFLPRRVGLARAKELIFSGRRVPAEEALRIGMIDRVTGADVLLAEAQAWAEELAQGSPAAIALSKSILNQSFETSAEQVFAAGSQAQGICYTTREHREAVEAFLSKRARVAKDSPR